MNFKNKLRHYWACYDKGWGVRSGPSCGGIAVRHARAKLGLCTRGLDSKARPTQTGQMRGCVAVVLADWETGTETSNGNTLSKVPISLLFSLSYLRKRRKEREFVATSLRSKVWFSFPRPFSRDRTTETWSEEARLRWVTCVGCVCRRRGRVMVQTVHIRENPARVRSRTQEQT